MPRASKSLLRIPLVLLTSILLLTGCVQGKDGTASLPHDGPAIPVSQEAALRFAQKTLTGTSGTDRGGVIRFTVSQEEVTSALAIGAQWASYSQGGPIFEGVSGLEGVLDGQEVNELLESQGSDVLQRSDVPPQIINLLENIQQEEGRGINLPDIRLKLEEPQVYFKGDGRIILRGYGRLLRWRLPVRMVIAPSASQGELILDFVDGQIGRFPMPKFLFDPLGDLLARVILSGRKFAQISELTVREGVLTFSGQLSLEQ